MFRGVIHPLFRIPIRLPIPHSPDEAAILSALILDFGIRFNMLYEVERGGDGGPDG